jgi:chromosome segregation ATPase
MTNEDRSALDAALTDALTRIVLPAIDRAVTDAVNAAVPPAVETAIAPLREEVRQNSMHLQAIEARLTALEDRIYALEQANDQLNGRISGVERELVGIRQQLSRMERNAVIARTEDRKLHADLKQRVEALEAK